MRLESPTKKFFFTFITLVKIICTRAKLERVWEVENKKKLMFLWTLHTEHLLDNVFQRLQYTSTYAFSAKIILDFWQKQALLINILRNPPGFHFKDWKNAKGFWTCIDLLVVLINKPFYVILSGKFIAAAKLGSFKLIDMQFQNSACSCR